MTMRLSDEDKVRAYVQEWYNGNSQGTPHYPFTLEEILRYTTAVADAIERNELKVPYLTPRCPECGMHIRSMTEHEKSWHVIIRGYVIVACEWYWVVNPNTVGIKDEWFQWWGDEDKGTIPGQDGTSEEEEACIHPGVFATDAPTTHCHRCGRDVPREEP